MGPTDEQTDPERSWAWPPKAFEKMGLVARVDQLEAQKLHEVSTGAKGSIGSKNLHA